MFVTLTQQARGLAIRGQLEVCGNACFSNQLQNMPATARVGIVDALSYSCDTTLGLGRRVVLRPKADQGLQPYAALMQVLIGFT